MRILSTLSTLVWYVCILSCAVLCTVSRFMRAKNRDMKKLAVDILTFNVRHITSSVVHSSTARHHIGYITTSPHWHINIHHCNIITWTQLSYNIKYFSAFAHFLFLLDWYGVVNMLSSLLIIYLLYMHVMLRVAAELPGQHWELVEHSGRIQSRYRWGNIRHVVAA